MSANNSWLNTLFDDKKPTVWGRGDRAGIIQGGKITYQGRLGVLVVGVDWQAEPDCHVGQVLESWHIPLLVGVVKGMPTCHGCVKRNRTALVTVLQEQTIQ